MPIHHEQNRPVGSAQGCCKVRVSACRRTAGCQPAIQQTASLRYDVAPIGNRLYRGLAVRFTRFFNDDFVHRPWGAPNAPPEFSIALTSAPAMLPAGWKARRRKKTRARHLYET